MNQKRERTPEMFLRVFTSSIELWSADLKILANELKIPKSTAYKVVTRCLRKLHLMERTFLKEYRLGLEPILVFFPEIENKTVNIIEQYFRNLPYFYNSGRFITLKNEQMNRDQLTLLINLRFPGSFSYKLMHKVKKLIENLRVHGFHWFRYDRLEHGYGIQRFGINVKKYQKFDWRGGIITNQLPLQPGDLSIIGYRLAIGSGPALPFNEIKRISGIPIHTSFASEKRLYPEIIAGKDIALELSHFIPVRDFRMILKNSTPDEIKYFRSAFPEHYFYNDVNDRELLVLLMVPDEQYREIDDFVAERTDRIVLFRFNTGMQYSHIFNHADLEEEYDYEQQKWKDPFRFSEQWQ